MLIDSAVQAAIIAGALGIVGTGLAAWVSRWHNEPSTIEGFQALIAALRKDNNELRAQDAIHREYNDLLVEKLRECEESRLRGRRGAMPC